jgi:hypothetical protein
VLLGRVVAAVLEQVLVKLKLLARERLRELRVAVYVLEEAREGGALLLLCLLYTSPSPRD